VILLPLVFLALGIKQGWQLANSFGESIWKNKKVREKMLKERKSKKKV
jgi:hypothetical protein